MDIAPSERLISNISRPGGSQCHTYLICPNRQYYIMVMIVICSLMPQCVSTFLVNFTLRQERGPTDK